MQPGSPAPSPFARSRALLEGSIVPSLLKLAGPIVLATILQSAYQLTDAWWVGRFGGAAVAAASVPMTAITLTWFARGDRKRSRLTREMAEVENAAEEILVDEGGRQ